MVNCYDSMRLPILKNMHAFSSSFSLYLVFSMYNIYRPIACKPIRNIQIKLNIDVWTFIISRDMFYDFMWGYKRLATCDIISRSIRHNHGWKRKRLKMDWIRSRKVTLQRINKEEGNDTRWSSSRIYHHTEHQNQPSTEVY